jgi:hypothetical protein
MQIYYVIVIWLWPVLFNRADICGDDLILVLPLLLCDPCSRGAGCGTLVLRADVRVRSSSGVLGCFLSGMDLRCSRVLLTGSTVYVCFS